MNRLDAKAIRESLGEQTSARLDELEVFAKIESTNSYLMQQPGPPSGCLRVVLTDNQTAGRGRHGRTWQSPPGSGLAVSLAYTYDENPTNLPSLTLAIGLHVIAALEELGIEGIKLKWPNDLIALDGKVGGILTEAQTQSGTEVTVVTGVGLNLDLSEHPDFGIETDWARRIVDLKSVVAELPSSNLLAASLVNGLCQAFVEFEAGGFAQFVKRWADRDWLFGREVAIDTPQQQIIGRGAGVAEDGALLVETETDGTHRVTSGSVLVAGIKDNGA